MGYLSLKNWDRFQHYKDRDPTWVKLYRDLLSSEAWVLGTDHSRLVQLASILIAARYANKIPLNWDLIRKVCSLDMSEKQLREAVEVLRMHGFLEVHNDQEDTPAASTNANAPLQVASTSLAKLYTREEESRGEKSRGEKITTARSGPVEFEQFKSVYPKRNGNQPWHRALKACRARISEGSAWSEILAGAQAYALWCRATSKEATEHVMQAATFCGPDKPFLQNWHAPPKAETAMDRIRRLNGDGGRTFDGEQDTAVVVAIGGALRG